MAEGEQVNQNQVRECGINCKICNLETFIHDNWKNHFNFIFKQKINSDNFKKIKKTLHKDAFFPSVNEIFAFTEHTKLEDVKVVIIGQDPYTDEDKAMGLAFSVPDNIKIPPTLENIFIELKDNFTDFEIPESGNLTKWAKRGVLLLNVVLTVKPGDSESHYGIGWESITTEIVKIINDKREKVVFMLWGVKAQSILNYIKIDSSKHLILKCPHPSPLSAKLGFFGCQHFSKANNYLGTTAIDWKLM